MKNNLTGYNPIPAHAARIHNTLEDLGDEYGGTWSVELSIGPVSYPNHETLLVCLNWRYRRLDGVQYGEEWMCELGRSWQYRDISGALQFLSFRAGRQLEERKAAAYLAAEGN